MFETGPHMNQSGAARQGEYGYGQGEWEDGYGQGEWEYPEGEEEYGYSQGEWEYPEGEGEQAYGYGQSEWEHPEGEEEYGYGQGESEWDQGEEEYPEGEEEWGEGEEQFLPALIPIIGQVLGGVLGGIGGGGRRREVQAEGGYGQGEEEWAQGEAGEAGEAEEELLGRILKSVLGQEAEYSQGAALTPAQETEFTERLLEVSSEEELSRILGRIVNTVGRAVQGIQGAVNSPQGRSIIDAVTPIAQSVLSGEAPESVLEAEEGELDQEDQFEGARRVVQLASAAAQSAAMAPAGAPPELDRKSVV